MKKLLDVHSDDYNIDGELYELDDTKLMIRYIQDGQIYDRTLVEHKWIPDLYLDDYGWMNLEELYEDIMLGIEDDREGER